MNRRRLFDLVLGSAATLASAPAIGAAAAAIYAHDRRSPFYRSERIGLHGQAFRFIKLRTMVVDADRTRVATTVEGDPRVTPVGALLRRLKLDELPQFWLVLTGEMSLVGPRPNVRAETDLYSDEERRLLSVRPGITDISSIVFSDLGEILAGEQDANLAYNQRIRPWKSRLGLLYVDHASARLDAELLFWTGVGTVDRARALDAMVRICERLGADAALCEVASRRAPPPAAPPPGCDEVVRAR